MVTVRAGFICGVACVLGAAFLAGCAAERAGRAVSHPRADRVEAFGLAAEFAPEIDRLTYFGGSSGRWSMLHVVEPDRPAPEDGSYLFRGGCYTWVAPQKGWVGPAGEPIEWPPDPAMDIGPARRVGHARGGMRFIGPEMRSGLREETTFRITASDAALLRQEVVNLGGGETAAGCWVNTAAGARDAIAVMLPAGSRVTGWDASSVERFRSILSEPDERGWAVADLSRARWEGGIKVYIFPPEGEGATARIAVWRRDARRWLLREGARLTAAQVEGLAEAGEGPVAVYIEPGRRAVIEAELYGPIELLRSGESVRVEETWRVIGSRSPDAGALR